MRRATLPLLRCPRCRGGPLEGEGTEAAIEFGPVRCTACGATFPVADGVLDLLAEPHKPSLAQRVLERPTLARAYERGVRSAIRQASLRARLDEKTELLAVRELAGEPTGPVLDLSCGTGLHARSLAAAGASPVIGVDRAPAMLEEAVHHGRESRLAVDLVRAEAEGIPVRDGALAAVVNVAAFHFYLEPDLVLAEVARVLAPGGRFVCGTLLPDGLSVVRRVESRAGVHRRSEEELEARCRSAGLGSFERLLLTPAILFRVVKPK